MGAGASFYVGLQKKKILFAAPRNPFAENFMGCDVLFVQILQWKISHFSRDFRDFFWKLTLGCKGNFQAVVCSSEFGHVTEKW